MTTGDPLDALGRELGAALRRELPRVRQRRRVSLVAVAAALTVAVPATGAVTDWAGLAGGETALPTQVRDGLKVKLASGNERGPWRLELYRAALGGSTSGLGLCVFVTRETGGAGRCAPESRIGALLDAGSDPQVAVGGGIVRDTVTRVELTVSRYDTPSTSVVAVAPSAARRGALAARGLPEALRSYAVVLDGDARGVVGVRALDDAGRTVATSGRPAAAAPDLSTRPSPILPQEPSP